MPASQYLYQSSVVCPSCRLVRSLRTKTSCATTSTHSQTEEAGKLTGVFALLLVNRSITNCKRPGSVFGFFLAKNIICWQLIFDITFSKLRSEAADMLDSPVDETDRRRWIACRTGKRVSKQPAS